MSDDERFPLPPTAMGDWVLLAPISHQAKVLYWALSAHMIVRFDDTVTKPARDVLAKLTGCDAREVLSLLDELATIDAVSLRDGRYVVHQTPPEGYKGSRDLRDFYASRIEAE